MLVLTYIHVHNVCVPPHVRALTDGMHVCVCVCVSVCVCVCGCVCVCMCVCVCKHVYIHIHICMHVCMQAWMYVCIYVCEHNTFSPYPDFATSVAQDRDAL